MPSSVLRHCTQGCAYTTPELQGTGPTFAAGGVLITTG